MWRWNNNNMIIINNQNYEITSSDAPVSIGPYPYVPSSSFIISSLFHYCFTECQVPVVLHSKLPQLLSSQHLCWYALYFPVIETLLLCPSLREGRGGWSLVTHYITTVTVTWLDHMTKLGLKYAIISVLLVRWITSQTIVHLLLFCLRLLSFSESESSSVNNNNNDNKHKQHHRD